MNGKLPFSGGVLVPGDGCISGMGISRDSWRTAGMVWPVAALIFVVIQCVLKAIVEARQRKS